jgi:hypothetical protein
LFYLETTAAMAKRKHAHDWPDMPDAMRMALGYGPDDALPDLGPIFITRLTTPVGEVWVKGREKSSGPRLGVIAQKVLSRLIPVQALRPATYLVDDMTLVRQARRADKFQTAGFHTARVLYADPDFLAMEHAGDTLGAYVPPAVDKADAPPINRKVQHHHIGQAILSMTRELSRLHGAGLTHGRPKMRDMVWRWNRAEGIEAFADGQAVFLDLEERPHKAMPKPSAKARDVFLWVLDLAEEPWSRPFAQEAADILVSAAGEKTKNELSNIVRTLSRLAPAARFALYLRPTLKEVSGAVSALEFLQTSLAAYAVHSQDAQGK